MPEPTRMHENVRGPRRRPRAADVLNELRAELKALRADYDQRLEALRLTAHQHAEAAAQAAADAVRVSAETHAEAAAAAAADAVRTSAETHAEAAAAAAAAATLEAARLHAEAVQAAVLDETRSSAAALSRQVAVIRRGQSVAALTRDRAEEPATCAVDPVLYVDLEDEFRGSAALVASRQREFLPIVAGPVDTEHPLADLGSGRGEWLSLLRSAGLPCFGVDNNEVLADEVAETGSDIVRADIADFLRTCEDESLGAITMFHVVEHLPFGVLVEVLQQAARVLRPGGVFIAETPNALNLRVASANFWIDPTHERPLHPEVLRFLARRSGFRDITLRFLHPLADAPQLPDDSVGRTVARLVDMVDGPGDVALVGYV